MKILFIEDDELKRERVKEYLYSIVTSLELTEAHSYQGGLRAVLMGSFDCVLLDMNLPTYSISQTESGGRIQHFAGRELLRQLQRKEILIPVIVLTQLDYFGELESRITLPELDVELKKSFPENYIGYSYFHVASEDWRQSLLALLATIAGPRKIKGEQA